MHIYIYIYIYTKIYINIFKHKVYVYHLGVWLRVHLGGRIAQVHTSDCQSSTDHVNVKAPTWQPGQFVRGGMPMGLAMLYPREWDWEVCNGTSASWHRLVKGSSEKHPGGSNYVTGQDPHFGFDCWQVCKNPNKGAPVEPKLTLVCYLVWWCFVFWWYDTQTLTHIHDFPMWSPPTPRIKNYWVIHCILKFDAFACRKPSKQELEIVLTSFNAEFKAPFKQEIVYSTMGPLTRTGLVPTPTFHWTGPCHSANRRWCTLAWSLEVVKVGTRLPPCFITQ